MKLHFSSVQTGVVLLAFALGLTATSAIADEADAKRILRAMSDYMSTAQTFSFEYDATLEVVTTDDQKLGLASSGSVAVARPDNIRASRIGGFSEQDMVFDGTTFSLLGKLSGGYVQMPMSGGIDGMIDTLRDEYGFPLPAADLLMAEPYDILMSEVTDIKDLGVGVIGGQICDHLAFRTPDVDWQIWIATGDAPYPCRFVITTKTMSPSPQYTIDLRNWNGSAEIDASAFVFTAPTGANKLDLTNIQSAFSELPNHFKKETNQ